MRPSAHVNEKKRRIVRDLSTLLDTSPVIGLVDMTNLPAPQLQKMKHGLRGVVDIRMAKATLIRLALHQSTKNFDLLADRLQGMPALLFTTENPFKLYKRLAASKSPAPARPGQLAPRDIVLPVGKTPFTPGPIIGELGQLGIKTGVEEGKVVIKQEKIIVKEGEEFTQKVAELLMKFNIFPMEVGLNVRAVYENGTVFDRKVLEIDEKAYIVNLQRSHAEAFALAVHTAYVSRDTVTFLIRKAHGDAVRLADAREILTPETVGRFLATAQAQAKSLKTIAYL